MSAATATTLPPPTTTLPPPVPGGPLQKVKKAEKKKKAVDRQTKKASQQRALATKQQAKAVAVTEEQEALDEVDDYSSAWRACQAQGRSWGGRGFGGRGVARQYQTTSAFSKDVIVDGVTLAFAGKELLTRSALRLVSGRRYLLTGRNGVGKTTLLRRIASHSLPGLPAHLKIGYVPQEPPPLSEDEAKLSALEALVEGACKRHVLELEAERDALEDALESTNNAEEGGAGDDDDDDDSFARKVDAVASRLCEVEAELEEAREGDAIERATKALKAVGFKKAMRDKPAGELSGGWRARVELAAVTLEDMDVILLDEPTNHLDLKGVFWLEQFLTETLGGSSSSQQQQKKTKPTVVFVSHDRAFAEAVATDVIVFEEKALHYFAGDLATFEQRNEEKSAAHDHRVDARVRQETQARESADKMKKLATGGSSSGNKAKKHANDNQLRAAKQRLAKIERVGLFRDDGKKFKTHSMAQVGVTHLPSKVEARRAVKDDAFSFPVPDVLEGAWYVALDRLDVGYGPSAVLVEKATASLGPGSRVAVCGDNGCGKTTLMKTLAALLPTLELSSSSSSSGGGVLKRHPKVRIAYVNQDHAASLTKHAATLEEGEQQQQGSAAGEQKSAEEDAAPPKKTTLSSSSPEFLMTASSYLSRRFGVSELEARSKLGKFGIGNAAKLSLKKLSGGQKARLSLAALTWEEPHVLLLDEPTNHLDAPALDALAAAVEAFPGAVVVVSHNRSFLSACCNELWTVEADKQLRVYEDADFNDLFNAYARRVLAGPNGGTGGLNANSRLSASAATLGRRADALDARGGKAAKGNGKLRQAGAAAKQASLM